MPTGKDDADERPEPVFEDLNGRRDVVEGGDDDEVIDRDPFADEVDIDDEPVVDGDDDDGEGEGEGGRRDEGDDDDLPELKGITDKAARDRIREVVRARQAAEEAAAGKDSQAHAIAVDNLRTKKALGETTKKQLEDQIERTKESLVKAKEEGETKQEVDLQATLTDLLSRKREVEDAQGKIEADLERIEKSPPQQRDTSPRARLRDDWIGRRDWFNKNVEARAAVIGIDAAMSAEGLDPSKPEYFVELDRRMANRFPELYPDRQGGGGRRRDEGGQRPRNPTVAGVQRNSSAPPKRGRVELDANDLRIMKRFGMDPKDKAAQREYARTKRGMK